MLLHVRFTADSNPSLSAKQSGLQTNPVAFLWKSLEIAAIPQVLPANRPGESVPPNPVGNLCGPFSLKGQAQSGFNNSIGRMLCDHKPMMWRKPLDFVSTWSKSPWL
jgi:hypothetical protein